MNARIACFGFVMLACVLQASAAWGETPAALPYAEEGQPQTVMSSSAEGVTPGTLIKQVPPHYPKQARKQKVEGAVVLSAVIGKDGSVRDVAAISGDPRLTDAAIEAVRKWKYDPFKLHGVPVDVHTEITVNFSLGQIQFHDTSEPDVPLPAVCTAQSFAGVPRPLRDGVSAPQAIFQPSPKYAERAREARKQGRLVLGLVVTSEGTVTDICVRESSVPADLVTRAYQAVNQWKFNPALKDGVPIAVAVDVMVDFKLY